MGFLKSAAAMLLAGAGGLALSATALAVDTTPAAAGPLTIVLTCDTGSTGSGMFTVTANGRSTTVPVKCGKSATVSNAAWKAGSMAVLHQTAAPSGALRARDVTITLRASAQTVAIRDFRAASTTTVATLAQTGSGVPALPWALGLAGLLLVGFGARTLVGSGHRG
ncbi:MAG: hypothetical protein M3Z28_00495 [Candidatus Dormibacteraeota bacterium]|nr:hypothetical protein [Candidatus Dormibacteraeota bacterium]